MKKVLFLFLATMLIINFFAGVVFAGGVAGMFKEEEKKEAVVSETEINIPQIKDGEEYYIRNRILEDMRSDDEISSQKNLPNATVNGQPASLIHQDSDKSVYGGPDSMYTPNTKIGVIILGE